MPWEPYDKLSKEQKQEWSKRVEKTNKTWGEKNERERKERVANALGFEKDKSKINSEATTSKNQSSSSKSQKNVNLKHFTKLLKLSSLLLLYMTIVITKFLF